MVAHNFYLCKTRSEVSLDLANLMSDIWLRLRGNERDIDAWKVVLMHCRKRNINDVRIIYEKALQLFPTYAKVWSDYIFHELSAENFNHCQQLFDRCLKKIPNLEIWRLYILFVTHSNKTKFNKENQICEAYEYALDNIGNDANCIVLWLEYIQCQKDKTISHNFTSNDRINAVRRAYHRVLQLPLLGLETAWKDYCNFENEININLAGKFIDELSKSYTLMKSITKELESHTKLINKSHAPVPYDMEERHVTMLNQWFDYILYEESNPIGYENKNLLISRIILCYEQAILILSNYPDIWFGYLNFLTTSIESLSEDNANLEIIESTKALIKQIFIRITKIHFPNDVIF
ncbi:MAG: Cleavage stimulation factor subunit 3, partial [Marteilia pararefringens]